jgi:hypothetical protein
MMDYVARYKSRFGIYSVEILANHLKGKFRQAKTIFGLDNIKAHVKHVSKSLIPEFYGTSPGHVGWRIILLDQIKRNKHELFINGECHFERSTKNNGPVNTLPIISIL